jgi:hypothetical protein
MVETAEKVIISGKVQAKSFLVDFSRFHYKASPYIEELISNYLKFDFRKTNDNHAAIFTEFETYVNEEEMDDLKESAIEFEDGLKYEDLVHWGFFDAESNIERKEFYAHWEDWYALYCYIEGIYEECDTHPCEGISFKITEDNELIVNDEFVIKLYN